MRLQRYTLLTSWMLMSCVSVSALAAKSVDLRGQPVSVLQAFFTPSSSFRYVNRSVDFTQTTHVRFQQTYRGYPVWGGDAVLHTQHGDRIYDIEGFQKSISSKNTQATMNGVIYQNLDADLNAAPSAMFNPAQAAKALQQAIQLHQQKSGSKNNPTDVQTRLMVYVDQNNAAHWVFYVTFVDKPAVGLPQKPTCILDAITFDVYQAWDDVKTLENEGGGGFGGNKKMGKIIYDGLAGNFSALNVQRDSAAKLCYLQNADVTVKDKRAKGSVMQFNCAAKSRPHNNLYWSASFDSVNGANSPGNDALYIGSVIKDMYQKWYGVPVLTVNGRPMMLNMVVHEKMGNKKTTQRTCLCRINFD